MKFLIFIIKQRWVADNLHDSIGQGKWQLLNFLEQLHGKIMRVSFGKEIMTEELGWDSIPEASSSKSIEGVHLVLKTLLIIINFFEIIYDFNIAFNGSLFLGRSLPFASIYFFLPLFFILAVLFAHHFSWSFGATFPAGPSHLSGTFACPSTNHRLNIRVWLV